MSSWKSTTPESEWSAGRGQLRTLVLRQGGRLALVGLATGLATSFALARFLRSLLYGMSERDAT